MLPCNIQVCMRACDVSNVCAVSIGICGLVYTHAYLGEYARVCVCVRVWQTLAAGLKLKPYAEQSS